MRKIKLFCVGKTQEKYLKEGIQLYSGKILPYCKFELNIIKEATYRNGNIRQWQQEEAGKISAVMKPGRISVVCDEKGSMINSVQLAEKMSSWASSGFSEIDFFIGGAYGFAEEIRGKATMLLSFSRFTMTHQMIRLFLMEQIYRSMTIIHGQKYHH